MTPEQIEHGLAVAAGLCRQFEGVWLRPYLCPAGVATIGIGSTVYEDGQPVRLTDPGITKERAAKLLMMDLRRVRLPAVMALCPTIDTPGRLAALLDFSYNLGTGALRASTLRRRVLSGRWDLVPGELRKWVRGGGRVLPGLVARREEECRLVG